MQHVMYCGNIITAKWEKGEFTPELDELARRDLGVHPKP